LNRRTAAKLAWSLCAVCMVLIGLAILLDFLTSELILNPDIPDLRPGPAIAVLTGVFALAYPTIGALIASRLPTNPVGWIFCGTGLFYAAQRFASAYADYALLESNAFPGGEYVAWFSTCLWFACVTLGVFLILLFPDGQLHSRRWRIVAWTAILGSALVTIGFAFMPEMLILTHPYIENPFEVVGVIGGRFTIYQLFGVSRAIGMMLLLASTLAALFSPILRLRRARDQERQQLKWFLFAAVPLTAFLGFVELDLLISNLTHDFWFRTVNILQSQILTPVLFVFVLSLLIVPLFTYIAILKHRLYDIDIIINRSLVYGALTVVIAGIFEGVDAVVHYFVLTFTHQEESIWSVIVAALAIAALFDPVKHRIKRFVDRRIFGEGDLIESGQPRRHSEGGTTS
jgi:hypothetical protein